MKVIDGVQVHLVDGWDEREGKVTSRCGDADGFPVPFGQATAGEICADCFNEAPEGLRQAFSNEHGPVDHPIR